MLGVVLLEAGYQFGFLAGVGEGARFEEVFELGVFLFGVVGWHFGGGGWFGV